MKHGTGIEWTHLPGYKGETWNPWVGCSKVSAGCKNCYALRMANRLKRLPQYAGTVEDGDWTGRLGCVEEHFRKPVHWRDPRAIFLGSMMDFFHPVADESPLSGRYWREHIWHTIYDTPQHLYLILTKRPERIPDHLPSFGKKEWPWKNVWLGATVENNDNRQRIYDLLKVKATKRFLSLEPMLGPVDLTEVKSPTRLIRRAHLGFIEGIHWVIVGGESGPGARPMEAEWARDIRDQCRAAGVPFFMKQMSKRAPIPKDLQVKEFPK